MIAIPSASPRRSKRREAVAAIRELALLAGPGGKLPTVRELGARLAVAWAHWERGCRFERDGTPKPPLDVRLSNQPP